MPTSFSARARALAATTAALVIAGLMYALPAQADTAPAAGDVETVSSDVLPTVQIDGIVWSTAISGNIGYAVGSFSNARPAGAAAGTNQTARSNVLAFNLTTGALIPGFVANTNGQVNYVAVSPDGSRVYLGGQFTTVNGTSRSRLAAVNATTGAVITGFNPSPNTTVQTVVATNNNVYFAGNFTSVGGTPRNRVASVNATTGALNPLSVQVDDTILSMAVSPDESKVVIGGYFTNINGSTDPGFGFGAISTSTSQVMPWNVNKTIRQAGQAAGGGGFASSAAIYSLKSDATGVYGTAYMFPVSGRTLEGSFRVDWANGDIVWLDTCKGDSYDVAVNSTTLYLAGHPHDCSTVVGGFPDASTQNPKVYHRGMAWSKAASANRVISGEFANWPTPTILNWWPDFNTGTFSGATQGPWTIAATDNYVVYAGEFTRVNNTNQQGLVRFAAKGIAPNNDGPRVTGAAFAPNVVPVSSGTVDVKWQTNWDRDNQFLKYELLRDGTTTTPIYTATQGSRANFERPTMTFRDSGLAPGSSHNYRVRATDPFGNAVTGSATTVTIPAAEEGAYSQSVLGDSATAFWRLGEASGSTLFDRVDVNNLSAGTGVTVAQSGALSGDADTAVRFPGTQAGVATSKVAGAPGVFTQEAWFKTSSTTGGIIFDLGSGPTISTAVDTLTSSDRALYIDASGRVGYNARAGQGSVSLNTTKSGYNDNAWHLAAVSIGATGARLYVDGALAGQNTAVTSLGSPRGPSWGYWRLGGDLARTPNGPTFFAGTIDEAAIYSAQLTPEQLAEHYTLSGRTVGGAANNLAPNATFTSVTSKLSVSFNAAASTDPDGTVASYAWQFGDGTTGTTVNPTHAYSVAGTYTVQLTVTDNQGATNDYTATVRPNTNNPPVASFTTSADGLTVTATSTSTDSDGTITNYAWNWGDNSPLTNTTTPTATHTYASAADYTITHTVTDDLRATAVITGVVTVVGTNTNIAPTASFTSSVNGLTAQFTSTSTDQDGTIAAYAWTFGDGATSTLQNPNRAYATAGTYPITLKVTDDKGASSTATGSVTVGGAGNSAPTASFTNTVSGLAVTATSTSTDADGTIATTSFDWGDGTAATLGTPASHTYGAAGTYTVTLTVTDDKGATGTTSRPVTVTAAAPGGTLATDTFSRTATGGLGSADAGGVWTVSGGSTNFSVSNGTGRFATAAGGTRSAYLNSVSSTDTDMQATATVTRPTAGSDYVGVIARRVGTTDYRARALVSTSGSVQLQLQAGSTTLRSATIAGMTVASGDQLRLRFQAVGTSPTTLNVRVWRIGTTEPTTWQLTTTDSTAALQAAGGVGLYSYLSASATPTNVTYLWDNVSATRTAGGGTPPANAAPVASFTNTVSGLTVNTTSTSTDSDGTIATTSWNWGDNTAATTGTPGSHTYATAGTYTVTLTVTDNGGATNSTSRSIQVTATPPANAAPTASFTNTVSNLTVNTTSTSTDSDGSITTTSWNWGDNTAATTGTPGSHTYAAAGTYTVTLTVTDNGGATNSTSRPITVTAAPAGGALASDNFTRTATGSWGTATVGGAWTRGSGSSTGSSVNGSVGRITTTTAGTTFENYLAGVSSTNADIQTTVAVTPMNVGGSVFVAVVGRRVGTDDYRARLVIAENGSVQLRVQHGATVLQQATAAGITYAAGDQLRVRLQVTGTSPTTIRAKVWKVGTTEPTAWLVTATDTTAALQTAGSFGLGTYVGGGTTSLPLTVTFDDFAVTTP